MLWCESEDVVSGYVVIVMQDLCYTSSFPVCSAVVGSCEATHANKRLECLRLRMVCIRIQVAVQAYF